MITSIQKLTGSFQTHLPSTQPVAKKIEQTGSKANAVAKAVFTKRNIAIGVSGSILALAALDATLDIKQFGIVRVARNIGELMGGGILLGMGIASGFYTAEKISSFFD